MKKIKIFRVLFITMMFIVFPELSNAQTLPLGVSGISGAYFDGTDDQAFSLDSRITGVAEVAAEVLVDFPGSPLDGDVITIGNCNFNFVNIPDALSNELNCSDNEVTIDITGLDNSPLFSFDFEAAMSQVVNITDSVQGSLTANTDSGLRFLGNTPVTVTTAINVSDLPGQVELTSSPAVIGVLQREVYELTGTLDRGDEYSVSSDYVGTNIIVRDELNFTELVNTIVLDIVNENTSDYEQEPYTLSTTTNSIIFTAKAASDDQFLLYLDTVNAVASPQRNVFYIIEAIDGVTYVITINGIDHEFTANASSTVDDIVNALDLALDSNLDVTCNKNSGTSIVCAGPMSIPFSYSVDAYGFPEEEGDGEEGGPSEPEPEPETVSNSGGGSATKTNKILKAFINNISESIISLNLLVVDEEQLSELQDAISLIIKLAEKEKIEVPAELKLFSQKKISSLIRDLELEDEGGDVIKLQKILMDANQGSVATKLDEVGATGYFGPLTQAALAEWQIANDVTPATGYFGQITRAKMKTLALAGIWW